MTSDTTRERGASRKITSVTLGTSAWPYVLRDDISEDSIARWSFSRASGCGGSQSRDGIRIGYTGEDSIAKGAVESVISRTERQAGEPIERWHQPALPTEVPVGMFRYVV